MKTSVLGLVVALVVAFGAGLLLEVDLNSGEIASRTEIAPGDLILALAAGAAGTLAFTSGLPAALVGVMVAVALLPPLVVLGMLLAAGLSVQRVARCYCCCATSCASTWPASRRFLSRG